MAQTFTSTDVVSTTNVFADNQSQRTNENTLRSTFSGSTQPSDPVVGQQWYDTTNSKTMQYNGTTWVPIDTNGTTQIDVSNAKGSLTSLTSYLRVAHNDDGTLKSSPATAIDEFKDNALVITYLSPTSFTVPSDLTSIFTTNRKVKVYLSTSTAISYVTSSTFSTVTTVTLGTPVLDATVTAVKYSIIQDGMPQDYSIGIEESTGSGVINGLSANVVNGSITVAPGVVHMDNGSRYSTKTFIFTPVADTTNPRADIIYISATGVISILAGTPSSTPVVPTLPNGGLALWVSLINAAGNISLTDARVFKSRYQNAGVINVKDCGAIGDGITDDTAAFNQAVLYAKTAVQSIYNRREAEIPIGTILIPAGVYNVPAWRIKKPVNIVCNGKIIGDVFLGDDSLAGFMNYPKIKGLACTNLTIYSTVMGAFEDIYAKTSVNLVGKNNYGLMYNKFSCISTYKFIIDVREGFVNLNRFSNIEAIGDGENFGIEIIGEKDCHGNVFETIDVSYGKGIKNSSSVQQRNTIIGMYLEGGGNQNVIGNFDIIGPVFPFTGDSTKIRTTWGNNMLSVHSDREGSKISYTPQNLATGGEWDIVNNGSMMCIFTSPAGLMGISTDATNPAGINNVMKGTFIENNTIGINLGVIRTGVVNVSLLYKGSIKELSIGTNGGLDQWSEYDDEGILLNDGWKLLRARKTTNQNSRYDLKIVTNAGDFEIGGVVSSNAEVIGVPSASKVCREIKVKQCGSMGAGTTSIDVDIPFSMSYTDVLDVGYTFINGGESMTMIASSYLKAVTSSSVTIHVNYTTPCSFDIRLNIVGLLL